MVNNESANEDPYFGQQLPFLLMFIGGPRKQLSLLESPARHPAHFLLIFMI